jgi:hypothetical protein
MPKLQAMKLWGPICAMIPKTAMPFATIKQATFELGDTIMLPA